ncbi:MAG: flagellar biosynthesis anti-sigma factor FlgM [Planctomycetota bacterium]
MADISSISGSGQGPDRTSGIERAAKAPADPGRIEQPRREREADSVSLSNAARSAAKADAAATSGEVRSELTGRVRAELDAGTYVTQDKLDAAVESLVDQILRGE